MARQPLDLLQIESWALRVLERISHKKPIEDTRVELKAKWPDPLRAARRIAGQANTCRGASVLWLVGVDEETWQVVGADCEELSTWWPQVAASFDEVSPELTDLAIDVGNKVVVALFFSTDRYPFVVKNSTGKGGIDREVPWREGTAVRSAHRRDLVLLTVRPEHAPSFQLFDASLSAADHEKDELIWRFRANLYAMVPPERPLTVPFHQVSVLMNLPGSQIEFDRPRLSPPQTWGPSASEPASLTIEATGDEVLFHGPGRVRIHADHLTDLYGVGVVGDDINVTIEIRPAFREETMVVDVPLYTVKAPEKVRAAWATHPSVAI